MTEEIQKDSNIPVSVKIWDRLLDSWDVIILKITSGTFLAITFDTIGYTFGVGICGWLAIQKLIEPAVFISVLSTYALLVQKTRENYFLISKSKQDAKTTLEEKK